MKAMVLSAGRGERMRPLTDECPKPLMEVGGKPLIVHTIERLVAAGVRDLVINHAWLGNRIEAALEDGSALGARIVYSPEPEGALETGGGVLRALPLLGPDPFIVVSGDVYTEYPFEALQPPQHPAHLVMVDNPPYHPAGDFHLHGGQIRLEGEGPRLTYANIAVLRPGLVEGWPAVRFGLGAAFRKAAQSPGITGEHYSGEWHNIGTPQDLAALNKRLSD